MKILVQEAGDEAPKEIHIPLGIAVNRVTAAIAAAKSPLSYCQVKELFRALRNAAPLLNGQPFVEVTEQSGDRVTIYL